MPRRTDGLRCGKCHTTHDWQTLDWEIVGPRWLWRCPDCHSLLRIDPYNPAPDTPYIDHPARGSQGRREHERGVDIPDRPYAG